MNFIKGTYSKGKFIAEDKIITLSAKDREILANYEDKEVYLGVRPETITLKGAESNKNLSEDWTLECDYAELLGYEFVLYTFIGNQKLILKTPVVNNVKSHDQITFNFDLDKLYFFDVETENRIK